MKKAVGTASVIVIIILIMSLIIALISWFVYNNTHFEQKEYSLSEIEPGVYCVYNTVSSAIPAENYEMVTLCCNDQIMTFKGDVDIIYSTNNARVLIRDYNIVNADNITVYIPKGTVKFQENFSVS